MRANSAFFTGDQSRVVVEIGYPVSGKRAAAMIALAVADLRFDRTSSPSVRRVYPCLGPLSSLRRFGAASSPRSADMPVRRFFHQTARIIELESTRLSPVRDERFVIA